MRHASEVVTVMTLDCDIRRSGPADTYHARTTWIGLPLRGVFTLHARRDEEVVHPAIAVVFPAGAEYRMSHPTDDGDGSVALGFAPHVTDEAFAHLGERIQVTSPDLRLRYTVGVLVAAIDRGADGLVIDELAFGVLRDVSTRLALAPGRPSRGARARVQLVRTMLAERPEAPWTLGSLAREAGWSPFHLAHQFRIHAGTTVHEYLAVLRAAAALERIEGGAPSLAAVAADLGFAHHSHLTATLRRRLGVTPRAIRALRSGHN